MKKSSSSRNRRPGKKPVRSNAGQLIELADQISSGRMLAWYALQQYDLTESFIGQILGRADRLHELSSQDRGLAMDVASGVVRRRRTIDSLLESQITRPRSNVETDLWRLLQMGVYQVAFSRTPDHAAVDTIVELARTVGCSRWCGFVNGILRNIGRLVTTDSVPVPAQNALPLEDGTFVRLDQSVLPNPAEEPTEYFGRAFSLPRSLARRWTTRLKHGELLRSCFYSIKPPAMHLRVNRLRATVAQVMSALQAHGVCVEPGHSAWSLSISHASKIIDLPGYTEGWWSVQDDSAMLAAELVAPKAGERILDLCSAPGGKTTQLAELSDDAASITACDVSAERLARVTDSIQRLQLQSVTTQLISRDGSDVPVGPFDAVLVDVPCSNTGVLARRPEARWRFRESDLEELIQIQTRLLLTAFENVREGGRIVYSTCSIEPEETTDLVNHVTRLLPDLKVMQQRMLLPGDVGDGAFQALLLRS